MHDQIDLSSAVFHSSPNVSGWPVTLTLQGVEFKPGTAADGNTVGVRPIFDRQQMNRLWPDYKPEGWQGFVQFTLWVFVNIGGTWHGAGLIEFWSDRNGAPRIWSGAPILTQWFDWVYRNQWGGEMEGHQPIPGEQIGFMLTSGDRRLMDLGDVRERTQVITVPLASSGLVMVDTSQAPSSVGSNLAPSVPAVDLAPVLARVDTCDANIASDRVRIGIVESLLQQSQARIATLEGDKAVILARLSALTAAPAPLPAPSAPASPSPASPLPPQGDTGSTAGQVAGQVLGGLLSGWFGRKK